VQATETDGASSVAIEEIDVNIPDILGELANRTQLTRRSIFQILVASCRLEDFKRNPQQFIEMASNSINRCKQETLVKGITYERLGDKMFYAQELFKQGKLTGYVKNLIEVRKSLYERVSYESDIEARFATELEQHEDIKLYTKLPVWFTIPTPLGSYNPDWAVLIESGNGERLYFVVETKGTSLLNELRRFEAAKILCSKKHFKALENQKDPARYRVVSSVDELLSGI